MATTHQCTKVKGKCWKCYKGIGDLLGGHRGKWRGRHLCRHTLPQTRVERPRRRFIDLRKYMRIIRKLVDKQSRT